MFILFVILEFRLYLCCMEVPWRNKNDIGNNLAFNITFSLSSACTTVILSVKTNDLQKKKNLIKNGVTLLWLAVSFYLSLQLDVHCKEFQNS